MPFILYGKVTSEIPTINYEAYQGNILTIVLSSARVKNSTRS